jgi:hypothetical protein
MLNKTENQRGSAGSKLVITLVVIFLFAHAGYNLIPALYQSTEIKQELHTAIVQGSALPTTLGDPAVVTKGRIEKFLGNRGINGAIVEVKNQKGALTGSVKYTKDIDILPFGLYKYHYNVDYKETPVGFLLNQ